MEIAIIEQRLSDQRSLDCKLWWQRGHSACCPFSNPDIKTYLSDCERIYNKYSSVIKNMDNTMSINALG